MTLDEVALRQLIGYASGDARRLLGILETAVAMAGADGRTAIEPADIARAAQSATLDYDRSGVVSAFIKSIRGSDPDAALYWLATALEAGEDPRYMARRLVVSAREDVGTAEPRRACRWPSPPLEAVEKIGAETNDEGLYALAQATVFLARAPKDASAPGAPSSPPGRPSARRGRGRCRRTCARRPRRTATPTTTRRARPDQRYLPRGLEGRRFLPAPDDAGE